MSKNFNLLININYFFNNFLNILEYFFFFVYVLIHFYLYFQYFLHEFARMYFLKFQRLEVNFKIRSFKVSQTF